ncbi:chromosome partitioning protein ParA [Vibrio sp. YMD68]|uniref:chromosome partitioning protein ParA n=1 Tax=Vibrio sp. YMD68 TaxID=3042300 RepID=UPI00249B6278|nr:chromosome partitioning protein ParA [Vibrio sp. YMD68]WGV99057.1 chromosome partitioning protein ParA [Vibrio sp. YMD68]
MAIPATHAEIEQIYLSAELSGCKSLCITACQSLDGVTSVASALTERYMLAGHNALLVDLNMFNPAFKELTISPEGNTQLIEHVDSHRLFTGVAIPSDQSTQLAYKDPTFMSHAVQKWQGQFDRVIIDTSPLLQINRGNIPAQSVASACDKTILVVKGGCTTSSHIKKAIELLSSDQIHLLGTILNVMDQPTLSAEMIRELRRIPFFPKKLKIKLELWLSRNEFLSLSA